MRDVPLGTLIFRAGLLAEEQLEDALQEGMRTGKRLGEVLLERGWLHERDLGRLLAGQKGLPFVELSGVMPDPTAVPLIPEEKARMQNALAIAFEKGVPVVAVADPTNDLVLENLRRVLGCQPRLVVAAHGDLQRKIDEAYAPVEAVAPAVEAQPAPEPPAAAAPPPPPEPVVAPEPAPTPEPASLDTPPPAAEPAAAVAQSFAPAPEVTAPVVLPIQAQPVPQPAPEPPAPVLQPAPAPPVETPRVEETPPPLIQPLAVQAQVAPEAAPPPPQAPTVPVEPEPVAVEPVPEPPSFAQPAPAVEPEPAPPAPEPAPELTVNGAAADASPHYVVLRLSEGEHLEIGAFASGDEAQGFAQEVVRQIAAAEGEATWPFFAGRFLRPATIVSVDVIASSQEQWIGSSERSRWASATT